jgi:hypothetical protein
MKNKPYFHFYFPLLEHYGGVKRKNGVVLFHWAATRRRIRLIFATPRGKRRITVKNKLVVGFSRWHVTFQAAWAGAATRCATRSKGALWQLQGRQPRAHGPYGPSVWR